jgi:hypothetical protein
VGDPRFTPDRSQPTGADVERDQAEAFAPVLADLLASDQPPTVDVVLTHDARTATDIAGQVPLVLAGHTHRPAEDRIDTTTVLVEGSTGGAGLRGFGGEEPEPLTSSVLYFNERTHRLVAYDRVTVGGLGQTGVRIERHTMPIDTQLTD